MYYHGQKELDLFLFVKALGSAKNDSSLPPVLLPPPLLLPPLPDSPLHLPPLSLSLSPDLRISKPCTSTDVDVPITGLAEGTKVRTDRWTANGGNKLRMNDDRADRLSHRDMNNFDEKDERDE